LKTIYKMIIISAIAILGISSLAFFGSVDDIPMICKDMILNSDQCHNYLNEKYMAIPAVSHFLEISDNMGLGMEVENFKVTKVMASAIEDKLVSHMEIDIVTSTIIYKCVALEDNEDVLVEIENPTTEDIDNNRCSSFETWHLKGRDELRCEQIGGDYNHPEYEGCALPSVVCNDSFDDIVNSDECRTGKELCKDLGGEIIESLSCRESFRAEHQESEEPLPCDFRGPSGCEFTE